VKDDVAGMICQALSLAAYCEAVQLKKRGYTMWMMTWQVIRVSARTLPGCLRSASLPSLYFSQIFASSALPPLRGLHSFTSRLNVSAFCGIGSAFRGCFGVFSRCSGISQGG
jgi:hypothetical protein